ncbi:MAG TPA: hypothetical protein VF570_18025, partial [Pyrinomonadaceae bacterium]
RLIMNHPTHTAKLARLSDALEELCSKVSARGQGGTLPQELADEIAATAGEVMVELADHRGDDLARGVIEDARRLRELVRSLLPEPAPVAEAGRVLISDLATFIRQDKRAA